MRQRKTEALILATLCVVIAAGGAVAQNTGAIILEFPLAPRSEAMGAGGVADMGDPGNAYFNPAGILGVNGIYAHGAYKLLIPQITAEPSLTHGSIGFARELKRGSLHRVGADITFARLWYGAVSNGAGGMTESWERYFSITGAVAVDVGSAVELALGATLKHWSTELAPEMFTVPLQPNITASATMADVGVVVSTTMDATGWTVRPAAALSLVNLGSDIPIGDDKDPLPSWFRYGLSARVDAPAVTLGSAPVPAVSATVNVDGRHGLNEQRPVWSLGTEISFMQVVFVRWGRQIDDYYRSPAATWGAALGWPVGPVRARLEYSSFDRSPSSYFITNTDKFGFSVAWLFDAPE